MNYQNKSDAEWDAINYKKDYNIAYFNSLNAAIEFCKGEDKTKRRVCVIETRDFFLDAWRNWYQDEIRTNKVRAGETPMPPFIAKAQAEQVSLEENIVEKQVKKNL